MAWWDDYLAEDDAWTWEWGTRPRTFGLGDEQAGAVDEAAQFGVEGANRGLGKVRATLAQDAKRNALTQQTGQDALNAQRDLLGLNGPEAEQAALTRLMASPQFESMVQQSEEAILANASATGGLRGGNVQQSLAQNRPAILDQILEQQYNRFGGLAAAGQQSGQFQSALGLQGAGMQADLYGQRGAMQAGNVLGQEQARLGARSQFANAALGPLGILSSLNTGSPGGLLGAGRQQQGPVL